LLALHAPKMTSIYLVGIPVLIYILDYVVGSIMRTYRSESPMFTRIECVVELVFKHPPGFHSDGTGYILVNLPWLRPWEWHAFSLFAHATLDDHSCVCMNKSGDWTEALHAMIDRPMALPAWVSGPFASPYSAAFNYSNIILVASGIGITPAMSLITWHRESQRRTNLIWCCRDASLLEFYLADSKTQFSERAWTLIFYTGKRKFALPEHLPPTVLLFTGRPNFEKVVAELIYGIERETGLPEDLLQASRHVQESALEWNNRLKIQGVSVSERIDVLLRRKRRTDGAERFDAQIDHAYALATQRYATHAKKMSSPTALAPDASPRTPAFARILRTSKEPKLHTQSSPPLDLAIPSPPLAPIAVTSNVLLVPPNEPPELPLSTTTAPLSDAPSSEARSSARMVELELSEHSSRPAAPPARPDSALSERMPATLESQSERYTQRPPEDELEEGEDSEVGQSVGLVPPGVAHRHSRIARARSGTGSPQARQHKWLTERLQPSERLSKASDLPANLTADRSEPHELNLSRAASLPESLSQREPSNRSRDSASTGPKVRKRSAVVDEIFIVDFVGALFPDAFTDEELPELLSRFAHDGHGHVPLSSLRAAIDAVVYDANLDDYTEEASLAEASGRHGSTHAMQIRQNVRSASARDAPHQAAMQDPSG